MKLYRHGDVILITVETLPAGTTEEPRQGDLRLAEGEVTGHAHRIRERTARTHRNGTRRFLRLETETLLTHEEHGPIALPAGDYEIRVQREYVPRELPRNVTD